MIFDLVIHNGVILTVNREFDIIEDGVVCIKNGEIVKIFSRTTDSPLPEGKAMLDARNGIVMPGLVNTHTHLPMALFRGFADDLPLSVWLNEWIFPAEAKHINPESVRFGALLSCAEMILSGTTTCCDGYFFENVVAGAVDDIGMRGVLGQGIIDFPAPGMPNPADNIKNAMAYAEKYRGLSHLITPSIFCHSPYTCSEETLKGAKAAADSKGILFQIHVAETQDEYVQFQTEHGMTPVKYLDRIGIVDPNTLMVHAIWIDRDDIEIISKRNAKVSHTPESSMKLASGIAPVSDLLKAGVTVGLGTDGCASNNDLDLFREMDTAAKLHKIKTLDSTVMNARTILHMATIGGAKAIGLDDAVGSLEAGKQADIVVVDTCRPHMVPLYNPESQIVYAANGQDVRDVIVSGNILVRDRKLLTVDLEDVLEKVNRISKDIREK